MIKHCFSERMGTVLIVAWQWTNRFWYHMSFDEPRVRFFVHLPISLEFGQIVCQLYSI